MKATKATMLNNAPLIGGITIEKVVREHIPVHAGGDMSFGRMIDGHLEETAMACETVRSVTVEINEDAWNEFAKRVQNAGEPVSAFDHNGGYRD